MPNPSSDLAGDLPQTRETLAASQSHSHLAFTQQELPEPSQCPFIDIRFSEYPCLQVTAELPRALLATF